MQEQIRAEIKTSLLAGDRFRSDTLKMALTALQYAGIAKGSDLSSEECIAVIQKEIKKRKEAAEMYRSAESAERVQKELDEIEILNIFVPTLLDGEELKVAVEAHLATLDASSLTFPIAMKSCVDALGNVDKGQLAGILKAKLS